MKTRNTRIIDPQGRVLLPGRIREDLALHPGSEVEVSVEEGAVCIRPAQKRCVICDQLPSALPVVEIGHEIICYACANEIAGKLIP